MNSYDATLPSGYWAIQARVTRTDADGWSSTRHLPTFYLHSNVQGILHEAAAVHVAVDMLRDMLAPGDDAIVNAMATYMG